MTAVAAATTTLKALADDTEPLPGHSVMEILDGTGDSKLQWDPNVPAEVAAAKVQFDSLKAKGYDAFRVGAKGEPGTPLKEFDPGAAQMIMVPRMVGG